MQTSEALSVKEICGHGQIENQGIPIFSAVIRAGLPTYGDGYPDGEIDLNRLLIENPESTFFIKVEGRPMKDPGIHPDDILIVDRSIDADRDSVVVADVKGELVVLHTTKNIDKNKIWGVVTFVIHAV